MCNNERKFYVYMWYFKDNGKVFHIGKGTGERYKNTKHRNQYFKNIIAKHTNNVDAKIYKNFLTEVEAWDLEKQLIKEYKEKGECQTNLHEGGCGGNTGNYDNPERSKKLSEKASRRVGSLNPMYGKTHSEEVKKLLREKNLGKKLTREHIDKLIKANTGRKPSEKQLETLKNLNKGKKLSKETKEKMMNSLCPFEYVVSIGDIEIFRCLGHTELYSFFKKEFGVSRTIVDKIVRKKWKPKFGKHKSLANLSIDRIERCID